MTGHFSFRERDIEVIKQALETMAPVGGFPSRKTFERWLRSTPISPALSPFLWGLFGATYPVRTLACWAWADAYELLKGKSGQLVETGLKQPEAHCFTQTIVDHLKVVLLPAYRSLNAVATSAIIVVTADRFDAPDDHWTALYESVDMLLPEKALYVVTCVTADAEQSPNLCLWIA
jgi:hypothetical protein